MSDPTVDTRRLQADQIAAIFGVPAAMLQSDFARWAREITVRRAELEAVIDAELLSSLEARAAAEEGKAP